MAPLSHTIYAVSLFLSLVALWLWVKRRRRNTDVRRGSLEADTRR